MARDFPVTVYHNPNCGTSRNVLEMVRSAGHEPQVVEYLKAGWTREHLQDLLGRMGVGPRDVLRARGTPAQELGLLEAGVGDERILDAMVQHPILVERPIVVTPKGARLCRPKETVSELLDQA
jgi:arsenate reductase